MTRLKMTNSDIGVGFDWVVRHLANMKVFWMGVGSCSHLDAARNLMSHALKLDPNFRKVTDRIPFRRSDLVARWEDALRKAGLPE